MNRFKDKKVLLAVLGMAISVLTAVLYAIFYGSANTNMNNMSWPAFGVLLAGAAVALLLCAEAVRHRRMRGGGVSPERFHAGYLCVLPLHIRRSGGH